MEPQASVSFGPKPEPGASTHSHLKKPWAIGGLLALIVVVAIGFAWWLSGGNGATHYTTAPVTRGAVTHAVTAK